MSYLMIRHVGRSNSPFFYVQRPFFRSKKGLLRKINPLFKGKIIAVIVFWLGGWVRQNVSGAAPSGHCTPAETANAEWSAADSSWVGLRAWDLKPSSRARILSTESKGREKAFQPYKDLTGPLYPSGFRPTGNRFGATGSALWMPLHSEEK